MVKLVVLGGSAVATPELIDVLCHLPDRTQPIQIVLYARRSDRLERVAGVAALMAKSDTLVDLTWTTDLTGALSGADLVLNQVRVGGYEARAFDESFPNDLGIPGEETVGPGGFSNAFRTIPVSLEYAKLMERACPSAILLNFANPSSMVQYAIQKYTQVHVVGLCNGPISAFENIARVLSIPVTQLSFEYVGMHHFGWVTSVWKDGQNLMPEVIKKADQVVEGVEPDIIRAIGAVPGPYFNYFFHADRMLAKKIGKRTRAEELIDLQDELLREYEGALSEGRKPLGLARRKARWYKDIVAPVIYALVEKELLAARGLAPLYYLNVTNGTAIPWLPPDAVVEVATLIEKGRFRPLSTANVPPDIVAMLQNNCAYEMLAVEAIVENDRGKALRALLRNPLVHTYDQAIKTVDCVWSKYG